LSDQAEIHRMAQNEDSAVRRGAAEALGAAFSHVPDKTLAWQDLHRLTADEHSYVQMYAFHSLGRACIFKATETVDKNSPSERFRIWPGRSVR